MHKVRLEQEFRQMLQQNHWWQTDERLLIAVSGGVDSMVLLHLLLRCLSNQVLGVIHFDHQLRSASKDEGAYLQAFCQEHQLPFYTRVWQNPPKQGIEAAARKARYAFFAEVMKTKRYDVLITAHHGDDQIETMLMKLMRHGNLSNVIGIRQESHFTKDNLRLVRPLLAFSKKELLDYAQSQHIKYFEDESNASMDYQRNRIRKSILPIIQDEQPQASAHFLKFSKQLAYVEEILAKQQQSWYKKIVTIKEPVVLIDLLALQELSIGERVFFWQFTFQQLRLTRAIPLKDRHIDQLERMLSQTKRYWTLNVEASWQWQKKDQLLILAPIEEKASADTNSSFLLTCNQSIYLEENQWIGLFESDEINLPEKVKNWSEFHHKFMAESNLCLVIRKRQAGDRIQLHPQLTKRISRWLIDQKIPPEQRAQAWVASNPENKIYSFLPFVNSYLSIDAETDKIRYILVYRYLA